MDESHLFMDSGTCELVGIFLLYHVTSKHGPNFGLFMDSGTCELVGIFLLYHVTSKHGPNWLVQYIHIYIVPT